MSLSITRQCLTTSTIRQSWLKPTILGHGPYENTETDKYNGGLNEYIDNLVPHVAEYAGETGAYGKVGQMQETGRDQGHAQMAAGLAVDICRRHGIKVMTSTPITTTESLLVLNSKRHTTLTEETICHGSTTIIQTVTLHGIKPGYKVDLMEVVAERCAHTGHVSSDITKE